ncbi:hypothetical protein [Anabaenopsis elenkinii]|uniref:Uncharacterized protein n=1 Tax=Anabaenopsis elenkinii CCIBt3563 TaxID=2779889 RepID=A0A7U3NMZ1_9CYAN|nr:hypothetical protein [Anabaenopsis elenkinii]QOV21968.1 hypothetical protein IM676_14820 [Anabaenopsis elenkinii CCIBt3563]
MTQTTSSMCIVEDSYKNKHIPKIENPDNLRLKHLIPKRMFGNYQTGNFYIREQGTGNREHTEGLVSIGKHWGTHRNNKIQFPPLTRTRQGGQGGQGDKGEKQYKVCIFSKKNSPLKDHCPYKIFLVHFPSLSS